MEINGVLKAILNSIKSIPAEFGACDYDTDYVPNIDYIEDQISKVAPNAAIYNGCSKCAIVDRTCDYVIKIPFRGAFYEGYDDEEDSFEEFQYANDLGGEYDDASCWDYCENELIKYEKAVDAGFGEFFAETAYYGMIDNTPIYIQEKASSYSERRKDGNVPSASDDAQKIYEENANELSYSINANWIELAIDWYGLERVLDFLNYIEAEDLDWDLHNGNIGFTDSGKPVLIDWAGWRD